MGEVPMAGLEVMREMEMAVLVEVVVVVIMAITMKTRAQYFRSRR
jgi:hypothetical protein